MLVASHRSLTIFMRKLSETLMWHLICSVSLGSDIEESWSFEEHVAWLFPCFLHICVLIYMSIGLSISSALGRIFLLGTQVLKAQPLVYSTKRKQTAVAATNQKITNTNHSSLIHHNGHRAESGQCASKLKITQVYKAPG